MLPRVVRWMGMAAVFVAVAGASAYLTLTFLIGSEDEVIVPDLVGKDVVHILGLLTDLGLNTKVDGAEYSETVPENRVIFQDPPPGETVKVGRDVRIVLSRGPSSVATPALTGLSLEQAGILLEKQGLVRGYTAKVHSRSVEENRIIAQNPAPGDRVARGDRVALLVSLGRAPEHVKMPELSGLDLSDAVLVLEKHRLVPGEIESFPFEGYPENAIVGQDPPSGHRIARGRPVRLVINRSTSPAGAGAGMLSTGVGLVRHSAAAGYLKRHIRVILEAYGTSLRLYDELVEPGEEIWILVPRYNDATVFIYEDGTLILNQHFE